MMTDAQYIEAFRNNTQKVISEFYRRYEQKVKKTVGAHYNLYSAEFLADVCQEAEIRMWRNIQTGKLTEENLSGDLAGYLYGIAIKVASEIIRKEKEVHFDSPENDEDGIPMDVIDPESDARSMSAYDEEERYQLIRETVDSMGKPCAPLLQNFYWDNKNWDKIARELGYSNANSAKTQKNKCMTKLKALFRNYECI